MSAENAESVEFGVPLTFAVIASEESAKKLEGTKKRLTPELPKSPFESVMGEIFNLECLAEHRWFSPEPSEWEEYLCGYPAENGTCKLLLHRKEG